MGEVPRSPLSHPLLHDCSSLPPCLVSSWTVALLILGITCLIPPQTLGITWVLSTIPQTSVGTA